MLMPIPVTVKLTCLFHIAHTLLHFYEKFKFKPMDSLFSNMDTIPAYTTAPGCKTKAAPSQVTMLIASNPDLAILATIPEKLQ